MSILQSIILGIVQGLTEFLPVSSSGHLVLVQSLLGVNPEQDFVLFSVLLHFGTLLAVIVAFWQDVYKLLCAFFGWIRDGFKLKDDPYRRLAILLLLTMLPMFAVLPIKHLLEKAMGSTILVGCMLLITAFLLWVSEKFSHGKKDASTATAVDAFAVGLAQCFALLPGISRSGTTMVAGFIRGFSRDFAVRFAFLMSIPVVLGANILEVYDVIKTPSAVHIPVAVYLVGILAAMLSGLFAIRLVKLVAHRGNFRPFVLYCSAVGILTILLGIFR